jgi:hypothetical protein
VVRRDKESVAADSWANAKLKYRNLKIQDLEWEEVWEEASVRLLAEQPDKEMGKEKEWDGNIIPTSVSLAFQRFTYKYK